MKLAEDFKLTGRASDRPLDWSLAEKENKLTGDDESEKTNN